MLRMVHKSIFYLILIVHFIGSGSLIASYAQNSQLVNVSLALQWHTQCQFAGYYVALEQGFYRDEGISLSIIPGASDKNPLDLVSSGLVDFGTKWLADFIVALDKGKSMTSIGQIVQSNGLILISKAKTNIQEPQDLLGKRIGIWFFGNEAQFIALMNKHNLPLNEMHIDEIKWSIKPFVNDKFHTTMAMRYNEYLRVLNMGYAKSEINVIDFADYGLNYPGQVLFTRNENLRKNPSLCTKMLRASLRGWAWAVEHQEEAVDIVLKYDKSNSLCKERQLQQMQIIAELIHYGERPLGYHEPEQVRSVEESLYENNVISGHVDMMDIYTNKLWKKAQNN